MTKPHQQGPSVEPSLGRTKAQSCGPSLCLSGQRCESSNDWPWVPAVVQGMLLHWG